MLGFHIRPHDLHQGADLLRQVHCDQVWAALIPQAAQQVGLIHRQPRQAQASLADRIQQGFPILTATDLLPQQFHRIQNGVQLVHRLIFRRPVSCLARQRLS